MAKLSYSFKEEDFKCKCNQCKKEFKISLGIVGALEFIKGHFRERIEVVNGYKCSEAIGNRDSYKKSYHSLGKAVDFRVKNIPIEEVFVFCETMPELRGIGFYPKENFVHIDLREHERTEWVFENKEYKTLSTSLRSKYKLNPADETK